MRRLTVTKHLVARIIVYTSYDQSGSPYSCSGSHCSINTNATPTTKIIMEIEWPI